MSLKQTCLTVFLFGVDPLRYREYVNHTHYGVMIMICMQGLNVNKSTTINLLT